MVAGTTTDGSHDFTFRYDGLAFQSLLARPRPASSSAGIKTVPQMAARFDLDEARYGGLASVRGRARGHACGSSLLKLACVECSAHGQHYPPVPIISSPRVRKGSNPAVAAAGCPTPALGRRLALAISMNERLLADVVHSKTGRSGFGQHLPFGRLPECPRRVASGGSGQATRLPLLWVESGYRCCSPPNPSYSPHSRDSLTGMVQTSGIA